MPDQLAAVCAANGLRLDALAAKAREVVLFGSRAAGCAEPSSDWDLLVIGDPSIASGRRGAIDLVAVPTAGLEWRSSELAAHTAHYGEWLHGTRDWGVRTGPIAVQTKRLRIARRATALASVADALHPLRRARLARRLVRDVQRLGLLLADIPVPPAQVLDGQPSAFDTDLLDALLRDAGSPPAVGAGWLLRASQPMISSPPWMPRTFPVSQ